jgi:NAD+ synthetase
LVLTTGNKSEMATGYCTLYGDMAGGFAVIKDIPKMLVYRLSRYRNTLGSKAVIPLSTIKRAPTAELRPGQKDQDSLPPYSQLDRFLEAYIEGKDSIGKITRKGIPYKLAVQLANLVDGNEYKRRQAAPCLKVSTKAFGIGRRIPIAKIWDQ